MAAQWRLFGSSDHIRNTDASVRIWDGQSDNNLPLHPGIGRGVKMNSRVCTSASPWTSSRRECVLVNLLYWYSNWIYICYNVGSWGCNSSLMPFPSIIEPTCVCTSIISQRKATNNFLWYLACVSALKPICDWKEFNQSEPQDRATTGLGFNLLQSKAHFILKVQHCLPLFDCL